MIQSVVDGNLHKSESQNTIDFNFQEIVIFDTKAYNENDPRS